MENPINRENDNENEIGMITAKDDYIRIARKGFYLYLPPVQALVIYLGAALIIGVWQSATKTQVYEVAFYAITGLTLLSPIVNVFVEKWWRNTGLYILSLIIFWMMLEPLVEPAASRTGSGIGEGAIIFMLPMILTVYAVPISGILKIIVNQLNRGHKTELTIEPE
jgi:hypothetical protein